MAQKYYSSEEAAAVLGVSEAEVRQMVERRELHGYRDGAQWKFKAEDIDQLAEQRAGEPPAGGEDDVLLSEIELGPSASGASGTVIGGVEDPNASADSDLRLGEEAEPSGAGGADELGSKVSQFEQLELDTEDDLTLEDSKATSFETDELALGGSSVASTEEGGSGGSTLDLAGEDLEDDDLVLGGSGAGSDITIGGDSGISLVDPADSGLSLDEPLEVTGGSDESLELGEDDMFAASQDLETAPTELKADDDFLLTPLEEVSEEEESESGSQVIALDLEGDEATTAVGSTPGGSGVAAMLEEDIGPAAVEDLEFGAAVEPVALEAAPMGAQPGMIPQGAPLGAAPAAALPEAPYTPLNIAALSMCTIALVLVGMMMFDLMRNMWLWDSAMGANSFLMDLIVK